MKKISVNSVQNCFHHNFVVPLQAERLASFICQIETCMVKIHQRKTKMRKLIHIVGRTVSCHIKPATRIEGWACSIKLSDKHNDHRPQRPQCTQKPQLLQCTTLTTMTRTALRIISCQSNNLTCTRTTTTTCSLELKPKWPCFSFLSQHVGTHLCTVS